MRRPSRQTIEVLQALLAQPGEWAYGYDLSSDLGIPSGSLYPILMRLHERGVLEARWVDSPTEGRPPRHMYRLTEEGAGWALTATSEDRRLRGLRAAEGTA